MQSLISSVVAGVTPVLPTTKRRSTKPTDSQTRIDFPEIEMREVISAGNGARAYAIGKTNNADLQIPIVPNLSLSMG